MNGNHEAVFIVDPDNGTRTSIRTLMKSVELRSEPFASPPEFLDYYSHGCRGCLILDIRMPGKHRQMHRTIERRQATRLRVASLTERERQVLELIVSGKPNKAMAQHLGLSRRTVEVHRSHLMHKLEATSVAELVRIALQIDVSISGRAQSMA